MRVNFPNAFIEFQNDSWCDFCHTRKSTLDFVTEGGEVRISICKECLEKALPNFPEQIEEFRKFKMMFNEIAHKIKENIQDCLKIQDPEIFIEVAKRNLELILDQVSCLKKHLNNI